MPAATPKYRAALIGTGSISRAHIAAFQAHAERVECVAAVDADPERAQSVAEAHGLPRWYSDSEQMLAQETPDLVCIATPPASHCDLSIGAMEAGAWVLCEKPLVGSLAELDRIMDAEQRTGNYTASVFQFRFGSGGQHLKQLIAEGEIGRPLVGQCLTTWFRGHDYYDVPWRGKWSTELGGVSMGHGIHEMDLFLWLMGEWDQIKADAATLDRDIEVEDFSAALVQFANGARGVVLNSVLCPRQETRLRLDFQRATVELDHLYAYNNDQWRFTAAPDVPQADQARWRHLPRERLANHTTQMAYLLDDMDAGQRPSPSGPGVRPTIEFLTALYKSAYTGETVERGSIVPGDPFYDAIHGGVASA